MSKEQDYVIGYKKPPRAGQFKPGQSGNPKGRPRKNRDANFEAAMEFLEPIGRQPGSSRPITALHAAYAKMLKNALDGDRQAMTAAINLILETNGETVLDMLNRCGLTMESMGLSGN